MAIVDKVVDKKGTRKVAQAYLEYLYSDEGQEIAARHYYRPRLEKIAKQYAEQFPKVALITIDQAFGGWQTGRPRRISRTAACFDQIYQPGAK